MPSPVPPGRGWVVQALAALVVLSVLAATGFYFYQKPTPKPDDPPPTAGTQPAFGTWPKGENPELVLVLTGQTYGYLSPCGCSRPQKGGLERRANLMDQLRAKGWHVVGLDLGDLAAPKGLHKQNLLKYQATMKSLGAMGYAAVGLGEYEFASQLFELLSSYTLNNPDKPPVVLSGNLVGVKARGADGKVTDIHPREVMFPGAKDRPMVEGVEVISPPGGKPAVAVVGVVGPDVLAKVEALDKTFAFLENEKYLGVWLDGLKTHPAKPQVRVMLYAGKLAAAKRLAERFPQFDVIVCQSDDAEPPDFPTAANGGKTLIIQVGHKGQNVGVLGVFRSNGGFEFKYQRVPLGEEYLTPDDAEAEKKHKVLPVLEWYAEEVKKADLLAEARKQPLQHAAQLQHPKLNLTYVGADRCMACHPGEHAVWAKTKHAQATTALGPKYAKRPGNRQFDPECVVCHSTGFEYATGFENEKKTPFLMHNQCENCHGPGSGHVAAPNNPQLLAAMMPWRTNPGDKLPDLAFMKKMAAMKPIERGSVNVPANVQQVVNAVTMMCMKCHDGENDPKFDLYEYFPKVHHSGLKKAPE